MRVRVVFLDGPLRGAVREIEAAARPPTRYAVPATGVRVGDPRYPRFAVFEYQVRRISVFGRTIWVGVSRDVAQSLSHVGDADDMATDLLLSDLAKSAAIPSESTPHNVRDDGGVSGYWRECDDGSVSQPEPNPEASPRHDVTAADLAQDVAGRVWALPRPSGGIWQSWSWSGGENADGGRPTPPGPPSQPGPDAWRVGGTRPASQPGPDAWRVTFEENERLLDEAIAAQEDFARRPSERRGPHP